MLQTFAVLLSVSKALLSTLLKISFGSCRTWPHVSAAHYTKGFRGTCVLLFDRRFGSGWYLYAGRQVATVGRMEVFAFK